MMNSLWVAMLLLAIALGAFTDRLDMVARASVDSAQAASALALGLVGAMCLWLGLMHVLRQAGVLHGIAHALRPIMARLFPGVPKNHPAIGMMVLNMTSNVLGLGNAATPFGLKAMQELDTLNPKPGTATDAMVLFLAINTSGLAVLPTGMVALRASLGSKAPGSIFLPTIVSTLTAALVGVVAAYLLAKTPGFRLADRPPTSALANGQDAGLTGHVDDTENALKTLDAQLSDAQVSDRWTRPYWAFFVFVGVLGLMARALYRLAQDGQEPLGWGPAVHHAVGNWILLIVVLGIVAIGVGRGVKIYDAVVLGGREGFDTAKRIIPYLVAILVAVGMLRASGAIDVLTQWLAPLTSLIGMPAEALPMALLRPLTGTGAYGIAADIMRAQGPDSLTGEIVSTIMGTTETTFYVLALYLGAVNVTRARHAVLTCLIADVAGTLMAVGSCRFFLH